VNSFASRPPGPAGPRAAEPMDGFDWHAIEREAKREAAARVDTLAETPLEFGAFIAWATTAYKGVTDGFSPLHRVGVPQGNQPYTSCHEVIPEPVRWLTLSPALTRTMDACRFCESEYHRAIEGQAHAA